LRELGASFNRGISGPIDWSKIKALS